MQLSSMSEIKVCDHAFLSHPNVHQLSETFPDFCESIKNCVFSYTISPTFPDSVLYINNVGVAIGKASEL